jgi:pheromone shutdown protein TraB
MTDPIDSAALPASTDALADQPHAIVERDGVQYTLLGTAHVSRASVDAVHAAIAGGGYDTIAVELDPQRLAALSDPEALAKLDLVKVLREGKTALFAANLGLAAYQRRLAEQLGIEPGAELKAAVNDADARSLPVHLIDRDVGLTFKRASQRLGWWVARRSSAGLITSLFGDEEVGHDEIEKLKQGDMLESSFGEFAKDSPGALRHRDRRTRPLHGGAAARERDRRVGRAQRAGGRRRGASARAWRAICATTATRRKSVRHATRNR